MISSFTHPHGFLSNFYACPVWITIMGEQVFPTAEHAFQASKCRNAGDVRAVLRAGTPAEAKAAGRAIACRPDWEQVKRQVMLRVVLAKFTDPELRERLAVTVPHLLVEGNTWGDTYWGAVPYKPGVPTAGMTVWSGDDIVSWAGENWLGRILMMVRDVL